VEIKNRVMRIWDRHRRLLAKVTRGTNRLYVLNMQVAQPLRLAARRDDEACQWHECFGHLHFEALSGSVPRGWYEAATYRWGNGGNALLVDVYIDDMVITGTKDVEVAAFKEEMKVTFQMSDLWLLSFYLGIEVHQGDSGITL
jgi:hypothetical protein